MHLRTLKCCRHRRFESRVPRRELGGRGFAPMINLIWFICLAGLRNARIRCTISRNTSPLPIPRASSTPRITHPWRSSDHDRTAIEGGIGAISASPAGRRVAVNCSTHPWDVEGHSESLAIDASAPWGASKPKYRSPWRKVQPATQPVQWRQTPCTLYLSANAARPVDSRIEHLLTRPDHNFDRQSSRHKKGDEPENANGVHRISTE